MAFQLGAALLDACVLSVLEKEDTYGYVLTQNVREVMSVSESTLYPVLRRLQKGEYYTITDKGREQLEDYRKEWDEYKSKVEKILMGGEGNEQG